jgi:hypothetical protein
MASILNGVVTSTDPANPDIIFDSSTFGYKPRTITVFCRDDSGNPANGDLGVQVYPMHNDASSSSVDDYFVVGVNQSVAFTHDMGPHAGGNVTQIRAVAEGAGGRSEYLLNVEK